MELLLKWILSYVLPFLISFMILSYFALRNKNRIVFVHCCLLLSILLCNFFILNQDVNYDLKLNYLSVLFMLLSLLFSTLLLKKFGVLYFFSALIQQSCMISISILLLTEYPVLLAIVLVAPIYALAHLTRLENWKEKLVLTAIWGTTSVLLFWIFKDPLLNIGLHSLLGSFLIGRNVFYVKN